MVCSSLSTLFLNRLDTPTDGNNDHQSEQELTSTGVINWQKTRKVSGHVLVFNHWVCAHTCNKVSKPNGGQGDDNKVQGFKCRPSLNVFEDGGWKSHKQQAAKQHKQQGGDDTDLCLRDGPLLQHRDRKSDLKKKIFFFFYFGLPQEICCLHVQSVVCYLTKMTKTSRKADS